MAGATNAYCKYCKKLVDISTYLTRYQKVVKEGKTKLAESLKRTQSCDDLIVQKDTAAKATAITYESHLASYKKEIKKLQRKLQLKVVQTKISVKKLTPFTDQFFQQEISRDILTSVEKLVKFIFDMIYHGDSYPNYVKYGSNFIYLTDKLSWTEDKNYKKLLTLIKLALKVPGEIILRQNDLTAKEKISIDRLIDNINNSNKHSGFIRDFGIWMERYFKNVEGKHV